MILVDRRTGSVELLEDISLRVKGQCAIARPDLAGGDFAFEGNGPDGPVYVGIERKCLGDMLGSMRQGRLSGDQLVKMGTMYDVCYLVVEGLWGPDQDGFLCVPRRVNGKNKWQPYTLAAKGPQSRQFFRYSELDKFLQALEVQKNLIVIRSASKLETVWQIVNRYYWWQKKWDSHDAVEAIKKQTELSLRAVTDEERIIAAFPGIGLVKARKVLAHFGSVENAVNALSGEWAEISGVSEIMAVRIYGMLRRKYGKAMS